MPTPRFAFAAFGLALAAVHAAPAGADGASGVPEALLAPSTDLGFEALDAAVGFVPPMPPGGFWTVEMSNISYSHDGAPTAVPLPAALPAFTLALGLLGWLARRWVVA